MQLTMLRIAADHPKTLGGSSLAPFLPQTRRSRVTLVALVVAALGVGVYAWFGPTALRQARRMAVVREHIPIVERQLATDPTLADVRLFVATGYGGTLGVNTTVGSEAELEQVKRAVDATSPLCGVLYVAAFADGVHQVWCPPN